jgi:4-aminobutyrate aminotransferase-like enzyme
MLIVQAFAGIVTVSVGHCHPKVVQAVDKQNHLLQHTTNIYLNNEIAEYAQELTAKLPGKLNVSLACFCGCCQQHHACPGSDLARCGAVCRSCLRQ